MTESRSVKLALDAEQKALECIRRVFGVEHPTAAYFCNRLGVVSRGLGNYAAARNYHEQALAIRRKVLGEDHSDTPMSYNNQGVVSEGLGDYSAARKYFERAVAIRRKVLGREHPDTGAPRRIRRALSQFGGR